MPGNEKLRTKSTCGPCVCLRVLSCLVRLPVVDQEQSRVKADIRKLSSEVAELTENINANKINFFRSSVKMEQIHKQMNWNQQQLSE